MQDSCFPKDIIYTLQKRAILVSATKIVKGSLETLASVECSFLVVVMKEPQESAILNYKYRQEGKRKIHKHIFLNENTNFSI